MLILQSQACALKLATTIRTLNPAASIANTQYVTINPANLILHTRACTLKPADSSPRTQALQSRSCTPIPPHTIAPICSEIRLLPKQRQQDIRCAVHVFFLLRARATAAPVLTCMPSIYKEPEGEPTSGAGDTVTAAGQAGSSLFVSTRRTARRAQRSEAT